MSRIEPFHVYFSFSNHKFFFFYLLSLVLTLQDDGDLVLYI